MIETIKTQNIPVLYSNHEATVVGYTNRVTGKSEKGLLVTPANSRIFPNISLIISGNLFKDANGTIINGITPIDLLGDSREVYAKSVDTDIANADIAVKAKLRSILFLQRISVNGKDHYRVVRPAEADFFYLITSWDRDRDHIGTGASRKYAKNHGAEEFSRHCPKSNKSGQDFWILPITVLTSDTIDLFDSEWFAGAERAIREHALRYPKDASVADFRKNLANPQRPTPPKSNDSRPGTQPGPKSV